MVQYRLNIETESRIRWKVYVRFGGEHLEIAHVHMIRRRVLSLHYIASFPYTAKGKLSTKNKKSSNLTTPAFPL